jgi:hypothetical protein
MKNLNYAMTVLTLVLAAAFVASGKSGGTSNQQSGTERWEYCYIYDGQGFCNLYGGGNNIECVTFEEVAQKLGLESKPSARLSIMSYLGGKGWELMSTDFGVVSEGIVADRMWFKRRL